MTRVLLDQGISPVTAGLLREQGFDAIHVCELGMERAEDAQILEIARLESRVCVTLDHDFHSHLAATGHGRPSVVLLRVQSLDSRGQAELIEAILRQCELVLVEGAAISADRERIRIRRLPLR
ncbi:MAG: DUF5615 family PIN-like protein [Paludibaculum sp.]